MATQNMESSTEELLRQSLLENKRRNRSMNRALRLVMFFAFCCLMLLVVIGVAWVVIYNAQQAAG